MLALRQNPLELFLFACVNFYLPNLNMKDHLQSPDSGQAGEPKNFKE